jgi:hypothetical protein
MTYRLFSLILAGLLALPCADAGAEALEPGQHAAEAAKESFRAKRAEAAGRPLNVSPASVRLINTAETAAAADIASMIKDGADVNLKTRLNETPLLIAARKNSADALKVLLDAGAKPAQTDKLGWTALMQAAMSNSHADVVPLLRNADSDGRTALMLAMDNPSQDVVRALIKAGASVTAKDKKGRSVLDFAKKSKFSSAYVPLLTGAGAK